MDKTGDYPNSLPVRPVEEIIQSKDPLLLNADDETLVQITRNYDTASKSYFAKVKLKDRQNRNFAFLFGREDNDVNNLLEKGKNTYQDNVLYEIESSLKPLATSKDPDILVYPANESEESTKSAEDLTLALQHSINTRELKEIKALAFKHLPVYFIGAVKYRWNPEKGKNGDYEFLIVHPQNLVLDNNAKGKDINKMDFVIEYQDISAQQLIMRFPEKKDELLQLLIANKTISEGDKDNPKALATQLKISEVWFKYYEKKGEGWTKISAVLWKYHNIVFKKIKNPNWHWEGETHFFSYDDEIAPEQIMESAESGQAIPGFETKEVFYNYFEEPEFPYIFIGYDDWNTMIYDETSRIEQLIRLQENVNTRGNQVKKMLNRAMGKHIFSTEANLKAEDLEEMDWENMNQAIIVDGKVSDTHGMAVAEQPSPAMIQNYGETRQIMFQKGHVNAITGAIQSNTATSNQIAREANFTYADDLVDATINLLSEKMARAILQMIKLRYTEEHFVRLIGQEGKTVFQRLHRDMIEDGMEVTITASGVDKLQAQNRAMEMAQLQLIDPLTFYEDVGAKNAPERTKRLMTFLTSPEQYMAQYVMGLEDSQAQANALNGTGGGGQQALLDIQQIQQGQIPQVPQQIDQEYAGAIAQFLQSPEFSQLPPEIQQGALQFGQQVAQALAQTEQQQQSQAFNAPTNFGKPAGSVNSNPQNPTSGQTSNIPINPPASPDASPRNL